MIIPILITILTCAAILWIMWYYGQFPKVHHTGTSSQWPEDGEKAEPTHRKRNTQPALTDQISPWLNQPPGRNLRFDWIDFDGVIGPDLRSLPAQAGQVIKLHFGIGGQRALTVEEIGARLNLSLDQVRRIRKKALSRLRQISAESDRNMLDDNWFKGFLQASMDPAKSLKSFDVTAFSPGCRRRNGPSWPRTWAYTVSRSAIWRRSPEASR